MARLDMTGVTDLWNRIGDVFARKAEAAKSLVLNGTSLVLNAADGNQLSSVGLSSTFATNDYVMTNCIYSAGIEFNAGTGLITIRFYNGYGTEVDSVAWTS